jgi:hypothetical protein
MLPLLIYARRSQTLVSTVLVLIGNDVWTQQLTACKTLASGLRMIQQQAGAIRSSTPAGPPIAQHPLCCALHHTMNTVDHQGSAGPAQPYMHEHFKTGT